MYRFLRKSKLGAFCYPLCMLPHIVCLMHTNRFLQDTSTFPAFLVCPIDEGAYLYAKSEFSKLNNINI